MAATRTDWLIVNGVKVRLVIGRDEDGTEFVELQADGNLEGVEPGLYYPTPCA
jgi:hypothetical protein